MRVLVTGGAGFIGSNFVLRTRATAPTSARRPRLDDLRRPTGLARRRERRRSRFVEGDVADAALVDRLVGRRRRRGPLRRRVAQRQHPRRPVAVRATNVVGTFPLLEAVRRHDKRFHHISTDEVYGDLELDDPDRFTEDTPYNPSSPYSATKAGADLLVRAWVRSFGIRATISNCSNNYGPRQHVEKFIPRQITNILDGIRPKLYGTGLNVRDWIHVDDHNDAVWRSSTGPARRDLSHRRGRRGQQPRHRRDDARAHGPAGRLVRPRQRPPGPRPALRDRPDQLRTELGWRHATRTSATGSRRRSTGTAPTRRGGGREGRHRGKYARLGR